MRKIGLLVVLALLALAMGVSAQDSDTVNVRVAHLSPDTPSVDIWVDGEVAIEALEYGTVTDWVTLPAGAHTVAVGATGLFIEGAYIRETEIDLPAGEFVTIAAIGSRLTETLTAQVLVEDFSELGENEARVGVFHALDGAPAVDVLANDEVLIEFLAYPGTQGTNDGYFSVDAPAGVYDVRVEISLFLRGEAEPTAEPAPDATPEPRPELPQVITLDGVELTAGSYYFIAATGTAEAPELIVAVTDAETAAGLRGE